MLWYKFTYYVIILGGGGGVSAMIILITQGGVGGPEMGKTWLRNMCTLPNGVASRPPERRPTGSLTARAKIQLPVLLTVIFFNSERS